MSAPASGFQGATKERGELNQYWFSEKTAAAFVQEVEAQSKLGAAFVSTPSLYFSLKDEELRKKSKVLEFDTQWESDPGFVMYDYRKPEQIPVTLFGAFDYVIIDPPFITEEVWKAYSETARLLLCPGGKLLCTTVAENGPMMKRVMGVEPVPFRPSIPSLVYQYETFTSYRPTVALENPNPEVPMTGSATDQLQRAERESYDDFVKQMSDRDRKGEAPIPTKLAEKSTWDRVPEGLTEYPEGATAPPPAAVSDHGEEYAALSRVREQVGECREVINQITRPLDRVWKTAVLQRKATKEGDDEKKAKAEADHAGALAELKRLLGVLEEQRKALPTTGRGAEVADLLESVADMLYVPTITKQQYQDLMPAVQQKYLSPLFNHQKGLLSEMKAAKRAKEP